jgi:hypothetical protein
MEKGYDYIVVGSSFGGSVACLLLSEKIHPVDRYFMEVTKDRDCSDSFENVLAGIYNDVGQQVLEQYAMSKIPEKRDKLRS